MGQVSGSTASRIQIADQRRPRAAVGFILQRGGTSPAPDANPLMQSVHVAVVIDVPVRIAARSSRSRFLEAAQSRSHRGDSEDLGCAHRGVLHHVAVLKAVTRS